MTYLVVSGASLLAVAAVMTVTALVARRQQRVAVVDTAWGLGFVVVALVAATVATLLDEGHPWRRWVVLALVGLWGLRLARHMHRRNSGKGEDPRYAEMLGDAPFSVAVRRVFLTQGVAMWFVSLPVQITAAAGGAWGALAAAGSLVFLVGLAFESIGDAQLAAYKKDPERGPVMDRGLWAWTRHPNYFGDAAVWWGIWLIAASAWPGALTVLSPLVMTWFLVRGTGARLLERTMMQRPGYPEYAARTSMFLPWPPKRGRRRGKNHDRAADDAPGAPSAAR
ncbi:DUF1295 domain-containing protein [Nocardioides sp.]|uniref:DUF1295 domain-containing protein n=1 Tax=Nocardioides sp. TaxID=35761 RepID=UPI0027367512|nr:DUF1295 domain-containing protein [Nocardioides sp.]MDP3892067.1 DUF1295 domain-containing protein [Nocardioides sp.]